MPKGLMNAMPILRKVFAVGLTATVGAMWLLEVMGEIGGDAEEDEADTVGNVDDSKMTMCSENSWENRDEQRTVAQWLSALNQPDNHHESDPTTALRTASAQKSVAVSNHSALVTTEDDYDASEVSASNSIRIDDLLEHLSQDHSFVSQILNITISDADALLSALSDGSSEEICRALNIIQSCFAPKSNWDILIDRGLLEKLLLLIEQWPNLHPDVLKKSLDCICNATALTSGNDNLWDFTSKLCEIFHSPAATDATRRAVLRCCTNLSNDIGNAASEDEFGICLMLYTCNEITEYAHLKKDSELMMKNLRAFYCNGFYRKFKFDDLPLEEMGTLKKIDVTKAIAWYDHAVLVKKN